jgi:hypothetical protein
MTTLGQNFGQYHCNLVEIYSHFRRKCYFLLQKIPVSHTEKITLECAGRYGNGPRASEWERGRESGTRRKEENKAEKRKCTKDDNM